MSVFLESGHDIGGADAAVEVPVFGGVGLDRDALLGELGGLLAEFGLTGQFDLLQLHLVLVDHPLVMVAGLGREALWDEVVVGVAGLHFDDLALFADVLNRVNEQQFDATALAFGERLERSEGLVAEFAMFGFHGRWPVIGVLSAGSC